MRGTRLVGSLILLAALAGATPAAAALPQQSGEADLLAQANLQIDGPAVLADAGVVAAAGDVNGDGIADVIVGAPGAAPQGRSSAGAAYVVFGRPSPTGVDLASLGDRGFEIDGTAIGDGAGTSVDGLGDVNGDGLADVAVAAPFMDNNGRSTSGSVYVVFGTSSTRTIDLAALGSGGYRIDGTAAAEGLGASVARAGDVNGDGRPDVVIGARNPQIGSTGPDRAWVVFGKASTGAIDLASLGSGGFRMDGPSGSNAGEHVDGLGDMNGDGLADVIVGAPRATAQGRSLAGSSFVVFGRASSDPVQLASLGTGGFRIDGPAANDQAGAASAAGDVNGDGRADALIGDPFTDNNGRTSSGSAFVVLGKSSTTTVDLAGLGAGGFRIDGAAAGDLLGGGHGVGDVNGDALDDVAVAAPDASAPSGRSSSGAVYVVFGRTAPTTVDVATLGAAGFKIDGASPSDQLGVVGRGADVNGDGRSDVLLGVPFADNNGRTNSGSAYAVFGFGTPSLAYPRPVSGTAGRAITPAVPSIARTGTATFSVSPPLPAGLALDAATGVVSGTPVSAGSSTHTVTMSDLAGSAQAQLTVAIGAGPGGGPPIDSLAPSVSSFALSPRKFAVAAGATPVTARAKKGTTFRFRLSEKAATTIAIARMAPGRRVGRRCVKPSRRNSRKKRCSRFVAAGALRRADEPAGRDEVRFTGRIGRKALRPGTYRATITATDSAGNKGVPRKASFTVVRR